MVKRLVYRPGMTLGPRDLYVGRGRGRTNLQTANIGEWGWLGNPFEAKLFGLDQCIEMYAKAFISKIQLDPEFAAAVAALDVDNVYCWCPLDKNCHGDFIVTYLEER